MLKNVLVIDDHPLFREAMASLVESLAPTATIYRAGSAEEGARQLREHDIELVLMDLGLPGAAGVDAYKLVRRGFEGMVVVVSGSDHRQEIDAVSRAGATVVVSKGVPHEKLREVVGAALNQQPAGEGWIRSTAPLARLSQQQTAARLTARQQQIAALLLNGHSNKEIGIRLGLAEITVKTHLTAIFRQLSVTNRTQAVAAIRRLGMEGAEQAH